MALIDDEPPSVFPRGMYIMRLLQPASGKVA
jgi:hypothetical protein